MPLSSYSAIGYGDPENISAAPWSNLIGTPAVVAVPDPFGGSSAYKITDATGVSNDARSRSVGALQGDVAEMVVCVKQDTAADCRIYLSDTTAGGVSKIGTEIVFSAGVPIPSDTFGSHLPPIPLGGGHYAIISRGAITKGNVHRLELYATGAGAAKTGATIFSVRNLIFLDLLDEATSWEDPRAESEFDQAPSGAEDSYIVGWDQMLEGRIRYVPNVSRADPGPVSGWYGGNESVGINCGIRAMLRAGRRKLPLTWVRDRSNCSDNQVGYLAAPMNGKPNFDRNGERQFVFQLRGSSEFIGV